MNSHVCVCAGDFSVIVCVVVCVCVCVLRASKWRPSEGQSKTAGQSVSMLLPVLSRIAGRESGQCADGAGCGSRSTRDD